MAVTLLNLRWQDNAVGSLVAITFSITGLHEASETVCTGDFTRLQETPPNSLSF
jgi:hypothetical protein